MKDRVALFAATTAVLEQLNLNIVDARINSTEAPIPSAPMWFWMTRASRWVSTRPGRSAYASD